MTEIFNFDDQDRAVVINRFDTPQPWINYLSNGSFHAFVSQAGGGLAWWKTPVNLRLTRYRQYNLPIDSPGFYVYIRRKNGDIWSPTFRPCEKGLDSWNAKHKPGKTVFIAQKDGLVAILTLFVAPDRDGLVWDLKLNNKTDAEIALDVFAYVELSQLNWEHEATSGYYHKLQLKTWFDKKSQSVNYLCHTINPRKNEVPLVFFAGNRKATSYSGSREEFMGAYRSERNPIAVENGQCQNSTIECGEPIAALHNAVVVGANTSDRLDFFLGVAPSALMDLEKAEQVRDDILEFIYKDDNIDKQLLKLDCWWENHFDKFQCDIPDAVSKRQINTWNVVNSVVTGRFSRSINTVAPGIRGVGFRDTCQDMLAIAYRQPQWAIKNLKFLLTQQFRDGHTVHCSFPEEKKPPQKTVHSDNHLWLPLLAYAILAETGDYSLLQEKIDYIGAKDFDTDGEGTIWEHLVSAMQFTDNNLGVHGIPLTFHSDWNDIIGRFNKEGRGETVFAGMQYVVALRYMVEIAEENNFNELNLLKDMLQRQVASLEKCSWDGQWWLRGFDDDKNPVGSNNNSAGKIFLNPQSWAVLSGVGNASQHVVAMDAVNRELTTGVGLKILSPGFHYWQDAGEAKIGYGPGCGENGAVFCHANAWAVIAEALLGNAERAWEYYNQLIPANIIKKVGIKRYRAEPYAWVSNIVGPENNQFGWGNVEQVTGTAAWMDVAATQYLIGLRPTLKGLLIAPCIPKDWSELSVTRMYRNVKLNVKIINESKSGGTVKSVSVDGVKIEGDLITSAIIKNKQVCDIIVQL